jgi:hypothetical protein
MNIALATPEQLLDIKRRIIKGHGELFTVAYKDVVNDENGEPVSAVDKENTYYIGKMTPGQTGNIVAIMGALLINGLDYKQVSGRTDNLTFVQAIDDYNLISLVAVVLGESRAWVEENWDIDWVVDVVTTFLNHNDFFGLIRKVMKLVASWNVDESAVRELALGQGAKKNS